MPLWPVSRAMGVVGTIDGMIGGEARRRSRHYDISHTLLGFGLPHKKGYRVSSVSIS